MGVTPSRCRRRDGGDGPGRPIEAPDASRGTPRRSGSRRPCQLVSPKCPARPNTNRSRPMGRSPVACAPGFYGGHAKPGPTPGRRRRRETIPVACAPGFYGGHTQPVPTPGAAPPARKRKLPPRVFTRGGSRGNFCSSSANVLVEADASTNWLDAGLLGDSDRRGDAARRCGGLRQRQARRLAIIGAALRYSHNASLNHLLYYEDPGCRGHCEATAGGGTFPGRRRRPAK